MVHTKIAVVYLYYVPYGYSYFINFMNSYLNNFPKTNHDFFFLCNGLEDISEIKHEVDFLQNNSIEYNLITLKKGYDIDAYFYAAGRLNNDYVLFLNTSNVILVPDWFELFYKTIHDNPKIGILSVGGNYQSYFSSVFAVYNLAKFKKSSYYEKFRIVKLYIKTFFYWSFLFKSFPNYHVRTSTFLTNRKLFLKYPYRTIKTKFEAYKFESGFKGITNFVLKNDFCACFIDKNGRVFHKKNAMESEVYCKGDQKNLIISDKQTNCYQNDSAEDRRIKTYLAWRL